MRFILFLMLFSIVGSLYSCNEPVTEQNVEQYVNPPPILNIELMDETYKAHMNYEKGPLSWIFSLEPDPYYRQIANKPTNHINHLGSYTHRIDEGYCRKHYNQLAQVNYNYVLNCGFSHRIEDGYCSWG